MRIFAVVPQGEALLSNDKIHVQTNTKSVQCLSINTKNNEVRINEINEQLANLNKNAYIGVLSNK